MDVIGRVCLLLGVGLQAAVDCTAAVSSVDIAGAGVLSSEINKNVNKLPVSFELDKEIEILHKLKDSDENGKIIWVIENGEPVMVKNIHFKDFQSNKTYVILEVRKYFGKVKSIFCDVFYWIGRSCNDVDAGEAAATAALINSAVLSLTCVHREIEGFESSAFARIFHRREDIRNQADKKEMTLPAKKDLRLDELLRQIIRQRKGRIVFVSKTSSLKGNDVRTLQKDKSVDFAEREDLCIVLYLLDTIYIYCGNAVSEEQKLTAQEEAEKWLAHNEPNAKIVNIFRDIIQPTNCLQEERKKLEQFLGEFGDTPESYFIPETLTWQQDVPISYQNLSQSTSKEEGCKLTIMRIHEDNDQKMEVLPVAESRITLSSQDCYVIDTCSDWGLLVWIGVESEDRERELASRKAELWLKEKHYNFSTPITFVKEEDVRYPGENDDEI